MEKWLNKIICGDCLEVMKELPDESIDLIVTDPPYLINYKTCRRKNKSHDFCSVIENDNNPKLISDCVKECYRVMKPDTAMYMFCNSKKVDFFKQELEAYFNIKNLIVWVKNSWTAGDLEAQFGKQYELIFLVNKGRAKFNGKRISDVWNYKRVVGKHQLHQNQKPVDLIEQCIIKHSQEGHMVLDPFLGSGTTAVAALNTGRFFIGIEKEPKYVEIAKQRIEREPANKQVSLF